MKIVPFSPVDPARMSTLDHANGLKCAIESQALTGGRLLEILGSDVAGTLLNSAKQLELGA